MISNPAAVQWLEADYDEPGAFRYPVGEGLHTPFGLFQAKPNHRADCLCETGECEIWLQVDVAAKWRAS